MVHSKDAGRVLDKLNSLGIPLPIQDVWMLEIAASVFFPNHIVGVVDHVLSGKRKLDKIARAQEQGWSYFHKPVFSLLTSRTSAHRPSADEHIGQNPTDWHRKAFTIVATTLVSGEVGREEMDVLLWEIPLLVSEQRDLVLAIGACKDQGKHSIYYLRGVLKREKSEREARTRDTMSARSRSGGWKTPEKKLTPEQVEEFERQWGLTEENMDVEWDDVETP